MHSILWIPPALTLGLLLAPGTPPQPGRATVSVGGLHLRIPDLPRSVADAKARHRTILRQVEQDLADVEMALKDAAPPRGPLHIPASQAAEARKLLDHLRDPLYPQLERAMALRLEALVAAHTAPKTAATPGPTQGKPIQPQAGGPPPLPRPLRNDQGVGPGAAEYGLTDLARNHHDIQAGGDTKADQLFTAEIKFRTHQQATQIHQDRRTLATWDQQLPAVEETWEALTRHLAQQALKASVLLAVPDPSRDPGLEILRLRVQQQLLQRYQASLRICLELWRSAAG